MEPLHTDRLVLAVTGPEHAPHLLAYMEENRAHLEPWGPAMPPELFALEWWQESAMKCQRELEQGSAVRLTIMARSGEPEVLGTVALFGIRRQHWQLAELGFGLARRHQGRGLMTEAVRRVVRLGFQELGLLRISASYREDNRRSGKVLRRVGFQVEGRARGRSSYQGKRWDQILTGILPSDLA